MLRPSPIDSLHLLVIDDGPLRAEAIEQRLSEQNIPVKMDLIDDKERLQKDLRQMAWDLVLFIDAYDFSHTDLIGMIRELGKDLPLILLYREPSAALNDQDQTPQLIEQAFKSGAVDVIHEQHLTHLVYAIRREHKALCARRHERRLVSQLEDADRRAQLLLKNSQSAVAYIQDGVHLFANDTYLHLFGYEDTDSLIGMPVIDLVAKEDIKEFKDFLRNYSKGNHRQSEFKFHGKRVDGSTFDAMLQLAPATFDAEPCIQVIIQSDAAMSAELEAQLAVANRTDTLTGLNNRQAFEEDLIALRSEVIRSKTQAALLFVSIDNIGQINASTGIAGSDATNLAIAESLRSHYPQAQIARFGESTFTVLCSNVTSEEVCAAAQKLVDDVRNLLISVDKRTVQTTLSVGIAMIGETSPQASELVDRAYNAADKVKLKTKGNGNGINLYNPAENASESDSAMHELLVEAIDKGTFHLMFQSLYDTQDDQAQFFEVYVRLPLADGKMMTPDEFMPIAQRFGLEGRLDRWVLLNACKHLKDHRRQYPQTRLLINLCAESLQDPSLPSLMGRLAQAVGGDINPLVLQFTESDVISYLKLAINNIHEFREQGCGISISNFGASLQALDTLNMVEATMVKLERNFVSDLSSEDNFKAAQKLVQSVNDTGREVILSYIESPTAMSKAWSMGARYLQGYYLQEPQSRMTVAEEG